MSLNVEILKDLISDYKKDFARISTEEVYKWEAVEWFQSHWDIDARDFSSMLSDALSKAGNLLAAQNFFPKRMLLYFSEKDPEVVRAMFKDLFNENKDLIERIDSFIAASDDLLSKYGEGTRKSHYQTSNSISVYLFFRYPDKYYIYKYRKFKKFAVKVGYSNIPKQGDIESVRAYFEMCNEVLKYVQDTELCEMSTNRLTDKHYPDSEYHILTEDIVFFGSRIDEQEQEWWPSNQTYNPGIDTEQWISLLNDKEIFTEDSLAIMKRLLNSGGEATCTELSQKYGESKNFYNSGSWGLARRVWEKTNCPLTSKEDSAKSKWWPILYRGKKADKTMEGSYIWRLRPELKEALSHVELSNIPLYTKFNDDKGYWWLNASPKIWSLSGIRVGEEHGYTLYSEKGNKRKVFQNFLDAKKDDDVIGYESNPIKQVVALCKVSKESDGERILFEKTETLSNPIDYSILKEIPEIQDMEFFANPQGSLFKLTKDEFDTIIDLIREHNPLSSDEKLPSYTKEDFLSSVYIDESQYDTLVSLLERKKNVILQGAPGVGKTYAAKRLAYSIIGNKNDEQIELIQFHQNYSYEDFIMGYKPNGDGFELKNGLFYRFCQKAENNPDKKYFFIIDEINRGNLSKIFGELLMLIEKDYRGTKTTLAYNGLSFSVPENVYIIGMMNTADRSLAMIDYALRRRFSFFDMVPAFYSEGFRAYQKSLNNEVFDDLIGQIKLLNQEIAKDPSLGDGFCIGHSYFCGQSVCTDSWIAEVIEYDLIPMLREYWFDDIAKVQKWETILSGVLND